MLLTLKRTAVHAALNDAIVFAFKNDGQYTKNEAGLIAFVKDKIQAYSIVPIDNSEMEVTLTKANYYTHLESTRSIPSEFYLNTSETQSRSNGDLWFESSGDASWQSTLSQPFGFYSGRAVVCSLHVNVTYNTLLPTILTNTSDISVRVPIINAL